MKIKTQTAIEPWLTISSGESAVEFYKSAFGAMETYRLSELGAGLVVRLSVDDAGFWVSTDETAKPGSLGGVNIRMILVVADPDELFLRAIKAGGKEVWPVGEDHGWRMGRLVDPFGLHWEIGRKLD